MGENLCAKNTVCATIDLGHFSIDINEQKKKRFHRKIVWPFYVILKSEPPKKIHLRETIHRNARPQKDQFMCMFFSETDTFFWYLVISIEKETKKNQRLDL